MGIQTYAANNAVIFDSDLAAGGICLGNGSIAAGNSFYKQFPLLTGCSLRIFSNWVIDYWSIGLERQPVISYPSGVPTVSIPAADFARSFTLWATGGASIANIPGMQAMSASGSVAISPSGRGLNSIGLASFNRYAGSQKYNSYADVRNVDYYRISSATEPTFVLRLYADSAVGVSSAPVQIAAGLWEIGVFRHGIDYGGSVGWYWNEPMEIYCYTRYTTPLSAPECSVYDTDGTLAYDLMRTGLLSARSVLSFEVGQVSRPSGTSEVLGVIGTPALWTRENPYSRSDQDGSDYYLRIDSFGGWRMSGSNVTIQMVPNIIQEYLGPQWADENTQRATTVPIIGL